MSPHRSGWLGWLPVSALEDSVTKWSLEDNEAMEVLKASDRLMFMILKPD